MLMQLAIGFVIGPTMGLLGGGGSMWLFGVVVGQRLQALIPFQRSPKRFP
jgi:hypothetical protein